MAGGNTCMYSKCVSISVYVYPCMDTSHVNVCIGLYTCMSIASVYGVVRLEEVDL